MGVQKVIDFDAFTKKGSIVALAKSSASPEQRRRSKPIDPEDSDALAMVAIRRARLAKPCAILEIETFRKKR